MTVPDTEALHNERDKTMNPIVYAIPVFMLTILLEAWVARRRGVAVYDIPDAITSLHHGFLSQVTNAFTKSATLGIYIAVYEAYRFTEWSMSSIPLWILALVLYDLCYYWAHRMGHEVNVMWASHVVHHSSEYYNLSTALRQTSTGALFGWVFYLPLAVLGIPWQMLVIVGLIDLLYQYWVHTELIGRMGVLDRILVTPSNHRVHHGQNDYCIDKNYGGILVLWDRLFGTFADERDDEKHDGIVQQVAHVGCSLDRPPRAADAGSPRTSFYDRRVRRGSASCRPPGVPDPSRSRNASGSRPRADRAGRRSCRARRPSDRPRSP